MALVKLYTKSYCPFSRRAKALLRARGVAYEDVDVTTDEGALREMVRLARGRTSVPQVFVAGRHVGGFAELQRLADEGRLDELSPGGQAAAPM